MKLPCRLLTLAVVGIVLCCFGCTSYTISSHPPGARIYFNGEDTGSVTPAKFSIRDTPKGRYMVSLVKEGYVMVGAPQQLRVKVSPGKVFWTVIFFPIAIPVELGTTLWKKASPRNWTGVLPQKDQTPAAHSPVPGVYPVFVTTPQAPAAPEATSIEKRLQNLNDLYNKSLITREEYEARRAEILKGL